MIQVTLPKRPKVAFIVWSFSENYGTQEGKKKKTRTTVVTKTKQNKTKKQNLRHVAQQAVGHPGPHHQEHRLRYAILLLCSVLKIFCLIQTLLLLCLSNSFCSCLMVF